MPTCLHTASNKHMSITDELISFITYTRQGLFTVQTYVSVINFERVMHKKSMHINDGGIDHQLRTNVIEKCLCTGVT